MAVEDRIDSEFRRIFLKFIVLKIIKEKPTHGYDIIKTVEHRSGGRWTPSPGSIYPILEGLEKNSFISSEEADRRIIYAITPKGEAAFDRMAEKKKQLLWEMIRVVEDATGEPEERR
jgi:DNA-binding PadR family transcriptional regulator